jgi:hypothetical protein
MNGCPYYQVCTNAIVKCTIIGDGYIDCIKYNGPRCDCDPSLPRCLNNGTEPLNYPVDCAECRAIARAGDVGEYLKMHSRECGDGLDRMMAEMYISSVGKETVARK